MASDQTALIAGITGQDGSYLAELFAAMSFAVDADHRLLSR